MTIKKLNLQGRFRQGFVNRDLRYVLYKVPSSQQLAVTFQQEQVGRHYIVREKMEDAPFCGQYLNTLSGNTAFSSAEIRAETLSYREQILRYHETHKDRMVAAFAGAGNITMNPRFMAYSNGRLAYTDIDAKEHFGNNAPALVVSTAGQTRFCDAVSLGLNQRNKEPFIKIDGRNRTGSTSYVIQGPCLVKNGVPISHRKLLGLAQEGWFYDLRHIIQFPHIFWTVGNLPPLEIDVGLEQMWSNSHQGRVLNKKLIARALRGDEIEIDLSSYEEGNHNYCKTYGGVVGISAVCAALKSQSYSTMRDGNTRGWYKIEDQTLHIRYHQGIYNHSILGLTKDGDEIRWLGLAGLGGRVGITMVDAARLASAHGLHNALLMDNGGDVMFSYRGEWVIRSGYGRTRIRGLLLFTTEAGESRPLQNRLPLDPI